MFKKLILVLALALVLPACHREQKQVLKGMIEQADTTLDYAEDNNIDDSRIDQINQAAADEVAAEGDRQTPHINNISQQDIDSARQLLREAGQEARAYGASRLNQ